MVTPSTTAPWSALLPQPYFKVDKDLSLSNIMKFTRMYFYWLILPLLFKEHATFEFLIESGTTSFISNIKMKELTLEISADLTKESIDTFTKACEDIGKLMLAYPPLLADTTIHLGAQRSYSKLLSILAI